jgi:hypothetical protein
VKLDVDTLATLPVDPPAAGPDRALDPPPPLPGAPRAPVAEGDVAVAEGDVAVADDDGAVADDDAEHPAATPITAHISAAPAIRRPRLFDSNRRTPGRPA